jgi:hypothetical protein
LDSTGTFFPEKYQKPAPGSKVWLSKTLPKGEGGNGKNLYFFTSLSKSEFRPDIIRGSITFFTITKFIRKLSESEFSVPDP